MGNAIPRTTDPGCAVTRHNYITDTINYYDRRTCYGLPVTSVLLLCVFSDKIISRDDTVIVRTPE